MIITLSLVHLLYTPFRLLLTWNSRELLVAKAINKMIDNLIKDAYDYG